VGSKVFWIKKNSIHVRLYRRKVIHRCTQWGEGGRVREEGIRVSIGPPGRLVNQNAIKPKIVEPLAISLTPSPRDFGKNLNLSLPLDFQPVCIPRYFPSEPIQI
jgi:hypothetical protein